MWRYKPLTMERASIRTSSVENLQIDHASCDEKHKIRSSRDRHILEKLQHLKSSWTNAMVFDLTLKCFCCRPIALPGKQASRSPRTFDGTIDEKIGHKRSVRPRKAKNPPIDLNNVQFLATTHASSAVEARLWGQYEWRRTAPLSTSTTDDKSL